MVGLRSLETKLKGSGDYSAALPETERQLTTTLGAGESNKGVHVEVCFRICNPFEVDVKSKRETEREISRAIVRFEKEFMGRGPLEARSYVIDDLVLVRLKNVLTPAELKLAESEEAKRCRYLIKQVRQELIEQGRPMLDAVIKDVLGVNVVSLHTDISAKTGERIIVFTLEQRPDLEQV